MSSFNCVITDTKIKTVTEKLLCTAELTNNCIIYKEVYYGDVKNDDELMPTTNELQSTTIIVKKEAISGIQKYWYFVSMVWGVKILSKGVTDDIEACFRKEEDADKFLDAVFNWAF